MSLYNRYIATKVELMTKLGKTNIHEVPGLTKVVVAMGIGSLATRKGMKDFSDLQENLRTLTGQNPQMILSKKSVSNFKLREGMPAMLKCTLRGKRAYDFIERLVMMALPRLRDFEGLSLRKFDGNGNYSLGFKDQSAFAELNPEDIKTPLGLQVTMCTSSSSDADARVFLESLGVIFEKR